MGQHRAACWHGAGGIDERLGVRSPFWFESVACDWPVCEAEQDGDRDEKGGDLEGGGKAKSGAAGSATNPPLRRSTDRIGQVFTRTNEDSE